MAIVIDVVSRGRRILLTGDLDRVTADSVLDLGSDSGGISLGQQFGETGTWALGPLKPGATKTFKWNVTAVRPGRYRISRRFSTARWR